MKISEWVQMLQVKITHSKYTVSVMLFSCIILKQDYLLCCLCLDNNHTNNFLPSCLKIFYLVSACISEVSPSFCNVVLVRPKSLLKLHVPNWKYICRTLSKTFFLLNMENIFHLTESRLFLRKWPPKNYELFYFYFY